MNDYSLSFSPVIGDAPRVLVLGTLPGKESLRRQQYYGHPRNAFWRIMFDLLGENTKDNYDDKLDFIKANNIALWDVCYSAYRPGSLDSHIKMEVANSIDELLKTHSSLKVIAFNGKKASDLFDKHFERRSDVQYYTLLSTSPANAAYSYEQKRENWSQIIG